MGRVYGQLSWEERCAIARLRGEGCSARQIAAALARSPSTIAAELKRNAGADGGYDPDAAQSRSRARRKRGLKLERDDALRERVLELLDQELSPQQVAGRLRREAGRTVISHEAIYEFSYAQIKRTKDYRWRRLLPQGRSRRRRRGARARRSSADYIKLRRPLAERPAEAAARSEPGHWEADLVQFGRGGPALLVLQDRCTRALLAAALPSKAADPLIRALRRLLAALPPSLRRSVCFDNGSEFVRHYELHALGVDTFCCDPHAPWQKGGVENAIGRLRGPLPRSTDLAARSRRALNRTLARFNNTPRKCLDFQTPAELLQAQLSSLQTEPTFPLGGGNDGKGRAGMTGKGRAGMAGKGRAGMAGAGVASEVGSFATACIRREGANALSRLGRRGCAGSGVSRGPS